MTPDSLHYTYRPTLSSPRLVTGFDGWMDGGSVSTGSIEYLVKKLNARPFATIDPTEYYIYNFPGSMEVSAMYRPEAVISEGLVEEYTEPTNTFYCSESHNMVLFSGREPNLNWPRYGDALYSVVNDLAISRMCFVGSVSGLVPHTKEPMFYSSATSAELRAVAENLGMNPTNYEGPASFGTYLITRAKQANVEMATIVAGVPAYVEGRNARCIEAAIGKVCDFLELNIETNDLKIESAQFVEGLDKIVAAKPEFREHVKKLEEAYEDQSEDSSTDEDLEDVRDWFERQDMERS